MWLVQSIGLSCLGYVVGKNTGSFLGNKTAQWIMNKNCPLLIHACKQTPPRWIIAAGTLAILATLTYSLHKSYQADQSKDKELFSKEGGYTLLRMGGAISLSYFFLNVIKNIQT